MFGHCRLPKAASVLAFAIFVLNYIDERDGRSCHKITRPRNATDYERRRPPATDFRSAKPGASTLRRVGDETRDEQRRAPAEILDLPYQKLAFEFLCGTLTDQYS